MKTRWYLEMLSKLTILCDRLIEAGWLLALIVAPLYFNVFSNSTFELDKVAAVRSIALVMLLVWAIKGLATWRYTHFQVSPGNAVRPEVELPLAEAELLSKGFPKSNLGTRGTTWLPKLRQSFAANPLPILALLWLGVCGVATLTSIAPRISLWGSYQRQEGLYTTGSYLVIFFSICALMRTRQQLERLITTVLLVSLPVALYGILQHFNLDPLDWGRDVSRRVSSTMGNPIFLAAFLIMTVPLTLYRLLTPGKHRVLQGYLLSGGYLVLLATQLTCILFTRSRGPLLGLLAGLLFFALLFTVVRRKRKWSTFVVGAGIAVILAVGLINLPNSPWQFTRNLPYFRRMSQIFEGSGRVRLLIWQGATQLIASEPQRVLLGYGPETMFIAFPPYYDPELRRLEGKISFPDRAHNATFDALITTGVLGCTLYLLFSTGLICSGMTNLGLVRSNRHCHLFLILCLSGGMGALLLAYTLDHSWRFLGIALPLGMLAGMFAYVSGCRISEIGNRKSENGNREPETGYLVIALLSAIIAHFVEIQFGIAVAATRVTFWAYAGLLIAVWRMRQGSPAGHTIPTSLTSISPRKATKTGMTANNKTLRNLCVSIPTVRDTHFPVFRLRFVWLVVALGALTAICLFLIITTSINVVRADMYFKQAKIESHEKGHYGHAIALYRRALELQPSQDFYYLFLGKAQVEKARGETNPQEREALFREAEMSLKKARALNPLDVDHTANLARLYYLWARYSNVLLPSYRDNLFQHAFDLYAQAVARCPGSVLLWNDWGYAHFIRGDHEQALARYRHALSLDSTFAPTYIRLGETYQAQGKWPQAAQAYRKAIAYDAIVAHSALGEMYARLGRFAEALRENRRVLELATSRRGGMITHTNLALLYRHLGKPQQALHHAQQALKVSTPKQRAPLENLIAQLRRQLNF